MEENKKIYKRFTPQEDAVIKEAVDSFPVLKDAISYAAEKLGRSYSSVNGRYFQSKNFDDCKLAKQKESQKRKSKIKRTLVKEIKKNPNNLQEAFATAASKVGLAQKTLEQAYYTKDSYMHKSKLDVCFAVVSGKKVIYNSKNSDKNQPKIAEYKTTRFFDFFKRLFK